MGLCKCPKRKVTNLFCYEHRVNVCDFCLVDNHPNCVVQSYLSWLTDSDYDPNCSLCQTPLGNGETIRLNCLHLLHWKCFDEWAASLPETTAPAGYRCPCCSREVFPPLNEVSPLVEKLREQLKQSNWARAALGLPVLPELNRHIPNKPVFQHQVPPPPPPVAPESQHYVHNNNARSTTPATHLDMDEAAYSVSSSDVTFARKKNYNQSEDTRPLLEQNDGRDADNEANKYKRRPAGEWVRGLWRAKYGNSVPQDRVSGKKIAIFVIFFVVVILITAYTVLKRAGVTSEGDPMFDPLANPNIRVAMEDTRLDHI